MDHERLARALRDAVDVPWIAAAWVAGSAAFDRADAMSDLDLQLLCAPERADDAFDLVERRLEELGGVTLVLPMESPDYRQKFYQLRDYPETCMLDLSVMRADRLRPFLDPVRHGRPQVWFDRIGVLVPVDDDGLAETFTSRRATLRDRVLMFGHIPGKALARGDLVEAAEAYRRMLLGPLIELLRAAHCPRRQDYGARYLRHDLPPEAVARLDRVALPGSPDGLGAAITEVRGWIAELLLTGEQRDHPRRQE